MGCRCTDTPEGSNKISYGALQRFNIITRSSGDATAEGVCLPIDKPLDRVLGDITAGWFQAFMAGTCGMFIILIVGHVVCPV